jgi:sugar lactone lactonase YvrE
MVAVANLTGPECYHGEGPVWSPTWGGLRVVDLLAGDLLTLRADGTLHRFHVGKVAAFHRPRVAGGYVVALERRLGVSDDVNAAPTPGPVLWEDVSIRFNDGAASPAGTLYGGTMAYGETEGAGALYRFGPDLTPEVVLAGVTVSNGLGFSPDGSLAYYNDTATHGIDVLDNVDDRLTNRRRFADIDPDDGSPDGLTVDADGGVWVALWGGGAVRRYDSDGSLSEVIKLPVSQVSACTFGGDDLRTLYMTTSRENLDEDAEPEAGSVFAAEPGVGGMPVLPVDV